MTMRCIFCNRPLTRATVILGGHPVGPDCSRKHSLIGPTVKSKRIERVPKPPRPKHPLRDTSTIDLFDEPSGSMETPGG